MNSSGSGSTTAVEKDKDSQWYFTAEQLANSPSRRHGIDTDLELSFRQMTAYLIQEMGQRLQVSQLCINTAIVYMHRFYAFHSFTHFHRNNIAAASLFLAAKVEEQPRKLEYVIKVANKCLNQPTPPTTDAYYIEQAQELVFNENVLLQTLGFDVAIDHPHTHVVKTCHLVKACKDLAQTSYFLASNSLHLTSMCLQYKPTVVACFCIYLACKWSRWEIPQSTEGKHWFHYVDKTVTMELLKQLTDEFIAIYEKSPSRLKSKLNSIKALAQGASNRVINKEKKSQSDDWKMVDMMKMYHSSINTSDSTNLNNPSAQTVPYPTPTTVEQQQTSNIIPALLPPPQSQQQSIRKSEMHSQHRSHHNSSHHTKIGFPATDGHDHKTNHKQQNFGSNLASRQTREISQTNPSHQNIVAIANAPRLSVSSSSGRSSGGISGQNIRQSSQTHLDTNYHKSREKNNTLGSFAHGVTSTHVVHKVAPKPDANRTASKDSVTKVSDSSKPGGNKIFGSSFGNVPIGNNCQSTTNQRGYGINNGSTGVSLVGYQSQHPRQSSSNNNNKHDSLKVTSVHTQQSQHSLSKPVIPSDGAYGHSHELQSQAIHQSNLSYGNSRSSDIVTSEDHSNSQLATLNVNTQGPATQSKSSSSMFSPEWNDKLQQNQSLANSVNANNNMNNTTTDLFNVKLPSTKESPKKNERERLTEANLKKDRGRNTNSNNEAALIINRPNTQSLQQIKMASSKKIESHLSLNDLTAPNASILTGIKRPNDTAFKAEDDTKIRRLDCMPYSDMKSSSEMNKLHFANGIETNPDLVRNLLKESLCTGNALLKSQELPLSSLEPPAELLASSTTDIFKQSGASNVNEPMQMDVNETVSGKSEKKKKKDKHKHKEKDKSKDREEKKKHKKDKDRHKDKDRESDNSEHVKIKISKDKLEGVGSLSESFKIKIPKDRIIGDISCSGASTQNIIPSEGNLITPTPALKIKISKDKLENYSSGSSDNTGIVKAHSSNQVSGFYSTFVTPGSSSGSTHSSKKKERDRDKDRDREKDKKRISGEVQKSNGSTYSASSGSHTPMTSSKSQNSSKFLNTQGVQNQENKDISLQTRALVIRLVDKSNYLNTENRIAIID